MGEKFKFVMMGYSEKNQITTEIIGFDTFEEIGKAWARFKRNNTAVKKKLYLELDED